jgi:hypothetical protein
MAGNEMTQLIFLQLNEINFDIVERYVNTQDLPAFRRLLGDFKRVETYAENNYHELEPWIQWVSAHSGATYGEHQIFRLGDAAISTVPQVFARLEKMGLRVGAISPMNARNDLSDPAYFIPDPWTATDSDRSGFSQRLTRMLRQTVNENAQGRISKQSLLTIGEAFLRSFTWARGTQLLKLIRDSNKQPWLKSLILDQLIHMVHMYQLGRSKPDVSFVFLNAGAHVQHHYLLNSPFSGMPARNPTWYVPADADPVLDMIKCYDRILADYLALSDRGTRLMIATGLTQVPYNRVKFYYRLKHHAAFLASLGVYCKAVMPRMTRDFEVHFDHPQAARDAASLLGEALMRRDGKPLFGDIDCRGDNLFASFTYPEEIRAGDAAVLRDKVIEGLAEHVAFVAIKNGMHASKGFAYFSPSTPVDIPGSPVHVASLFGMTLRAAGA